MKNRKFPILVIFYVLLAICLLALLLFRNRNLGNNGKIKARAPRLVGAPSLPSLPARKSYTFQVDVKKDLGAKGDGSTYDNAAFEKAFQQVKENGGGQVNVPAGTYKLKPIQLVSNLTLALGDGAKLQSGPKSDYALIPPEPSSGIGSDGPGQRYQPFIQGVSLENVIITGAGDGSVIDGAGQEWWALRNSGRGDHTRPYVIEFMYSRNVVMEKFKVQNSPVWTLHPYICDRVLIQSVTIKNDKDSPNTDGVDPESSSNVTIKDCKFDTGDDGVAIKSGSSCYGSFMNIPSDRILIECIEVTSPGSAGVAIGSEIYGGVSNITVRNCVFNNTENATRIKTNQYEGNFIRNVLFENITVNTAEIAVGVVADYYNFNAACPKPIENPPKISNVVFRNFKLSNITDQKIKKHGLTSAQEDGITIDLEPGTGASSCAEGFTCNSKHGCKGDDCPGGLKKKCVPTGGTSFMSCRTCCPDDPYRGVDDICKNKCKNCDNDSFYYCGLWGCKDDNCPGGLKWRCDPEGDGCILCCPGDDRRGLDQECQWGDYGDCLDSGCKQAPRLKCDRTTFTCTKDDTRSGRKPAYPPPGGGLYDCDSCYPFNSYFCDGGARSCTGCSWIAGRDDYITNKDKGWKVVDDCGQCPLPVSPCGIDATCDDSSGRAVCACPSGWTGDPNKKCVPPEVKINCCNTGTGQCLVRKQSDGCLDGETVVNNCSRCQPSGSPCSHEPCGVGAKCDDSSGRAVCTCPSGWTGDPNKKCVPPEVKINCCNTGTGQCLVRKQSDGCLGSEAVVSDCSQCKPPGSRRWKCDIPSGLCQPSSNPRDETDRGRCNLACARGGNKPKSGGANWPLIIILTTGGLVLLAVAALIISSARRARKKFLFGGVK